MKRISRKQLVLISVVTVLFLIFLFLSSFVKWWVQKNSEELIGRKITIKELHFNYAKVAVRVKGFNLFEQNKKESFVAFDELYVNVSPWNLLSGEYAVSQIYLEGLNLSVIQDREGFNFDDMLTSTETQAGDSIVAEEKESTLKFAIHDIKFKDGFVRYKDLDKKNDLKLENINLELPLIAWNNEKSEMGVNFSLGKDGNVSISADVDHALERYKVDLGVTSVDISPFVSYLKDYMHVSAMQGKVNTNIIIDGSMVDFMDVVLKGKASLNDFAMLDGEGKKFLAAQSTSVDLDSMHVGNSHYEIGEVKLIKPEIYSSLYKGGTNFDKIFAPVTSADTLSAEKDTTLTEESKLFYSVDSMIVVGGLLAFSDQTLNREFIYDIHNINLNVGKITEQASDIPVRYSINLNKGGKSEGEMKFSMKDVHSFTFDGKVQDLELMSFSPYTEFYIARPITQGQLNYDCRIEMKPNHLDNQNSIKVSEFDFGDKTNDPNPIKAPVRLALYLLKDQNDVIQFDLPVSGNPSEPDFKLGKIIWKTLMNFLVKTAAKPFGILGNLAGTNPESIEKLPFEYASTQLGDKECSTLKSISEIITKKPELRFSFTQETDTEKEKELLLLSQCVREYLDSTAQEYSVLNGQKVDVWANENIDFKNYLMQDSSDVSLPLAELCKKRIGQEKLELMFDSLLLKRNEVLSNYLIDSLKVSNDNFEVKTADLRNLSEQQKDPKYRVEVSLK